MADDKSGYGESDRDRQNLDDLVRWVKETSHPETEGELALPRGFDDRPSYTPSIPVIGFALQETSGGLLIPKQPARNPADMWGRYVTGSELTGYPMPLEDLRADLRRYPLFPLVIGLSNLTCAMEVGSPVSQEMKQDFLEFCTPESWRERLSAILRAEVVGISSPQVSLAALKLALKDASDVAGDVPFDQMAPIIYVMADHMTEDRSGKADERERFGLELARYALFYAQSDPVLVFARHYRMWLEIAPDLKESRDFMDLSEIFQEAVRVGLRDYGATTFWMYPLFAGRQRRLSEARNLEVSRVRLTSRLCAEDIEFILEEIAADANWFKEHIDDQHLAWDFTAFQTRPLLRRLDVLTCLSTEVFLQKATSGVFYVVLDHLRANNGDWRRWTRFFGDVWEEYVRRLLGSSLDERRQASEASLKAGGWPKGRKNSDNIILYLDCWLMIEAVAKRMNLKTAATGGPDALRADLKAAVLKKAKQLAATVEVLTDDPNKAGLGSEPLPSRFLPVIALPGPFPLTPNVVEMIEGLIHADAECAALQRPEVDRVQVLSADDLESAIGTSAAVGKTLPDILREWHGSSLGTMPFTLWVREEYRGRVGRPAWCIEGWQLPTKNSMATIRDDSEGSERARQDSNLRPMD